MPRSGLAQHAIHTSAPQRRQNEECRVQVLPHCFGPLGQAGSAILRIPSVLGQRPKADVISIARLRAGPGHGRGRSANAMFSTDQPATVGLRPGWSCGKRNSVFMFRTCPQNPAPCKPWHPVNGIPRTATRNGSPSMCGCCARARPYSSRYCGYPYPGLGRAPPSCGCT